MKNSYSQTISLAQLPLWQKMSMKRKPVSFSLELTARCNNDCRHCYINVPASDREALKNELSLKEISRITDEAVSLGAFCCIITGGEPLLRDDFADIYRVLKSKKLLVIVYTNATLINKKHIALFKKYPPREVEVTIYGVTPQTYERISRRPGSFAPFMRGLHLLLENRISVVFKTVALRSNFHEFPRIADFCRRKAKGHFRFDPLIHLRLDRDPVRNNLILSERLSADEITALEAVDLQRTAALKKSCTSQRRAKNHPLPFGRLFFCAGVENSFTVSYNGLFRSCLSFWHKDYFFDLKTGGLRVAWETIPPRITALRSMRKEFLDTCYPCTIKDLCLWCPAHAYLETGAMDSPVAYFCEVAKSRDSWLQQEITREKNNSA